LRLFVFLIFFISRRRWLLTTNEQIVLCFLRWWSFCS